MIGLALVTLVATLASGIIKPFTDAVDQPLRRRLRDHGAEQLFDPIPPSDGEGRGGGAGGHRHREHPGAATARSSTTEKTTLITVTGAEAAERSKVIDLDWQDGSPTTIDDLGANGAVVEQGLCEGSRPDGRIADRRRDARYRAGA